ncbi:MAG: glycosyltransferase family 39 protein [Rhizomicrobium sp.]
MSAHAAVRICLGAIALFCVAGLVRAAAIVPLHVPLDPNEGWNAYHALHAMTGEALYPVPDSFFVNNYPPLSFYIVGAFGFLTGDNIIAGRIVSLIALLAIAVLIWACARRLKSNFEGAAFAALSFVAGLLVFTDYVGMDDPQMLGHAVSLSGLVLLLQKPRDLRYAAAAAFLMAGACFIKHNLIALPAATAMWLLLWDRRSAIAFMTSGIVACLFGIGIFRAVYGIGLWSVLASARSFSSSQLIAALGSWLIWAGVPLAGISAFLLKRRDNRDVAFCALYAAVSIVVAVAFAGGAGVDMNIWFDAMIALGLGTALMLTKLEGQRRAFGAFALALPLIAGVALNWDSAWLEHEFWLHPLRDENAMAANDIYFIETRKGPALCEMLSLCYWAGKTAQVDTFNLGEAYKTHSRSDDMLVHTLNDRRYAIIEFDSLDDFALTPRVKRALLGAYRVDHTDDEGVFLVPVSATPRL